jgi:hypothetical protein
MQAMKPSSETKYQSLDVPYYTCCKPSIYKLKYPHIINRTSGEYIFKAGNTVRQTKSWLYLGSIRRNGFSEGIVNSKEEKNSLEKVFNFPLFKTNTDIEFVDSLTLEELNEIYESRSFKNF